MWMNGYAMAGSGFTPVRFYTPMYPSDSPAEKSERKSQKQHPTQAPRASATTDYDFDLLFLEKLAADVDFLLHYWSPKMEPTLRRNIAK